MLIKITRAGILVLTLAMSVVGCSATPTKPGGYQGEWTKPIDVVKETGLNALSIHGFEITKNEPTYLEGFRPRTWGFFCTPGGETAGVWLEQVGPSLTKVWITTAQSSFDRACQKDWTGPVLTEMNKSLSQ